VLTRRTWVCVAVTLLCCLSADAASAATWWHPPQQLTWYWQLTGTPRVEPVDATDIDGFDNSAATVSALHARGQHVICYIDVGTAENWRPDYAQFPPADLGANNGWPGEQWLNIADPAIQPIMAARFQMCQQKGFDAVEPDNMDGYENSTGFSLTAAQQLSYDEWVAQEVHSLGMAVLQKNDPDQAAALEPYFDGALDEQCNQYAECSSFQPYLAAGKPVLNAEYQSSLYPGLCSADEAAGIMGALYDVALDGATYTPCFGPSITTPGGSSPPPAPPVLRAPSAVDTRAPRVAIGPGPLTIVRGVVRVKLTCPAGQSYCAGQLGLDTVLRLAAGRHRARAPLALGAATFRLSGGLTRTTTVHLSSRALRRLGRRTRLLVAIRVLARDGAGRAAGSKRVDQLRLR
jgi:hypothetical protein